MDLGIAIINELTEIRDENGILLLIMCISLAVDLLILVVTGTILLITSFVVIKNKSQKDGENNRGRL